MLYPIFAVSYSKFASTTTNNEKLNEMQTWPNSYFFYSYDWSWQCLDKCSIPKAIFSLTHTNQDSPNWISGGCYLADHAMLYPHYHNCSSFVDPGHRFCPISLIFTQILFILKFLISHFDFFSQGLFFKGFLKFKGRSMWSISKQTLQMALTK